MENDKTRQGNKYTKTRKRKTTHQRDGSLSASNPARALDTLSGYHGKDDGKLNRRKNLIEAVTMKNAYKCKPGYRQTKQPWGGGAYDKVKEDKFCRGRTGCQNRNLIKR